MLTQQTLTRLRGLKLDGMAHAFEEQLAQPASHGLAFEERFGLPVGACAVDETESYHSQDPE